jgi:hypothetical protein
MGVGYRRGQRESHVHVDVNIHVQYCTLRWLKRRKTVISEKIAENRKRINNNKKREKRTDFHTNMDVQHLVETNGLSFFLREMYY